MMSARSPLPSPFVIPVCRASGKTGTHEHPCLKIGSRRLRAIRSGSVFMGPGLGLRPNRDDKRTGGSPFTALSEAA
jgi:hypothetical protein